jgi:hypothetical protein
MYDQPPAPFFYAARSFSVISRHSALLKAKTNHFAPHTPVFSALFQTFVLLYVLLVCKCVLYYCHRVATQLQLTHISYHISYRIIYRIIHIISYRIISYITYIIYYTVSYHISYHIIYHNIYITSYIISYHIVSYHII